MKCVKYLLLIISFLFVSPLVLFSAETKAPLNDQYKKFLDDVYWIMSDYEKNAFLSLNADPDRDRFIQAFWDSRDPTPGTPKNEFKEEHYHRLEYVNRIFSRQSPLPGWKTDEGRVYTLLGKPEFIKRFPNTSEFYPMELWHYVGYKGYGLPSSLYFLFYQNHGIGEYKLYSPLQDGLTSLVNPQKQNQWKTDEQLLDKLEMNLDPEIAHAAVSSIPSQSTDLSDPFADMASIGTEIVQAKVQNARNYQVQKRSYVEDILKDRPIVTSYYSIGTEGIRDGLYSFMAPNGNFYINYAIEYEPNKLDMGQYEDYYTSLAVDGQITTPDKILVDQIVGSHEIKLTKSDYDQVKFLNFQFQGIKPIVPGKYGITMIMNNNVSRRSVTFTHEIDVPDTATLKAPYITPLLPIRAVDNVKAGEEKRIRPFQVGDKLYTPNLPAKYGQTAPMQVYHQVIFPDGFTLAGGNLQLHYLIRVANKVELELTEPLNYSASQLAGNAIDIRKEITLNKLALGNKEMTVELRQGGKLLSQSEPFDFAVEPEVNQTIWKFSVGIPDYDSPFHTFTLAQQLLHLNKTAEALAMLKDAQQKYPDSTDIKLLQMRVALKAKDYPKVLEIGRPLEVKDPRNTNLLWLIGWAYYGQGKYDDAVRLFERYRMEDPKKTEVLNILADSYYRLDLPEKSLERLQQSLAIKPNQADLLELKKKVESMHR